MRKTFAILVMAAVLLGAVGTAFAENGIIWPFGSTKSASSTKIRLMEDKTIWPF